MKLDRIDKVDSNCGNLDYKLSLGLGKIASFLVGLKEPHQAPEDAYGLIEAKNAPFPACLIDELKTLAFPASGELR